MKTNITILFLGVFLALGCVSTRAQKRKVTPGMIKVTILYPNGDGKTFDMEYYSTKHMPLIDSLLGDALKFYSIDKGISGRTPADPTPFLAIGYLYFDTLSDYQESFAPHAQTIRGDVQNYTNIQPIIQISEVVWGE